MITGYSMGGIGTFKLAEQFPDLFARAQPTVGDSEDTNMIASLRNIPVLMWNAAADELVPPTSYLPTADELDRLGYRYELDVYTGRAPDARDQRPVRARGRVPRHGEGGPQPAARHLRRRPEPRPRRPRFVADHAYWLSGARTRGSGQGSVDAFSHGSGTGDPVASATQFGAGTLGGGNLRHARVHAPVQDVGSGAADRARRPHRPHGNEPQRDHDQREARRRELQRRPAGDERRATDGEPRGLQAVGLRTGDRGRSSEDRVASISRARWLLSRSTT